MLKPKKLFKGDKVAIVSLSSGMLGEEFCKHDIEIGFKRLLDLGVNPVFMPNSLKGIDYLREHPEARASDLKKAFMDEEIRAIFCAIGGDDTYRLIPYLLEDEEFIEQVKRYPKIFSGFSDTTINHLMFYKIGMVTYYGPSFINDIAELSNEMLPYTRQAFLGFFENHTYSKIVSSDIWYEERTDFSSGVIGTERVTHKEERGFELLQGRKSFRGKLLGGCIDSIYNLLMGDRYPDEKDICDQYEVFPNKEEWGGKILFLETSENKIAPNVLREELQVLKERGIFDVINGIIVGKPQDEKYYEEYKIVYKDVVDNEDLPILYNVNFGHSFPRTVIPIGIEVEVNIDEMCIQFLEEAIR